MNSLSSDGATRKFGRWISATSFEEIPPEVIQHIKLCILDALGCAVYGAMQPWGRIAQRVIGVGADHANATIWGGSGKAGAADAAFANGTAAHGFEIDDVHEASLSHPGAVTVPCAWALAETKGASGRSLLTAIATGYEVGLRVGSLTGPAHMLRGYHPTGTVGCLCASAAAASLLGLGPSEATHAIAIGATQAGGLYSASRTGAMVKRMHAGRAAQSGVLAGLLAENGFTGSADALEAPYAGFFTTLATPVDDQALTKGLGTRWESLSVGFKRHAACGSSHTIIDAVETLMHRGLSYDNLKSLTIRLSKVGMNNTGWKYEPSNVLVAQMNGYFSAAMQLIDGRVFVDQYAEHRLGDPRVLDLIRRMAIIHDPEMDQVHPDDALGAKVDAELSDGGRLSEFVAQRRGSAARPLSEEEIKSKFEELTRSVFPQAVRSQIISEVMNIEQLQTLVDTSARLKTREAD